MKDGACGVSTHRLAWVQGLWQGWNSRCRVPGLGFRPQDFKSRVQGAGCRFQGLGFRAQGLGSRVSGLGFRVQGFYLGKLIFFQILARKLLHSWGLLVQVKHFCSKFCCQIMKEISVSLD